MIKKTAVEKFDCRFFVCRGEACLAPKNFISQI
jgi:hypothetical protein